MAASGLALKGADLFLLYYVKHPIDIVVYVLVAIPAIIMVP